MNKTPLLSICIASYNRPKELFRCLKSIDVNKDQEIEVVVCEDKSPMRDEIKRKIENFSSGTELEIRAFFNEENLGFDRNLENLISKARGEYVLLMSDDDAFIPGQLDKLLKELDARKNDAFILTQFISPDNNAMNREYSSSFTIDPGRESACRFMYDAVLFSGLVFKRNLVNEICANRFVNLNYFQVYLSLCMLFQYGGRYLSIPLVECIGDGNNGYGTTELSGGNPLLVDRDSVFSNLEFNRGLIKVIKLFDQDNGTDILSGFEKEYAIRSYRGLSAARKAGKETLRQYWNMLHDLGIEIHEPAKLYYFSLICFGSRFCDRIFSLPRKLLFFIRKNSR